MNGLSGPHLVRGGGFAVHRPTCRYARLKGMVRWAWAAQPGTEFRWLDGHPVRSQHNDAFTHHVTWLRACKVCRPDEEPSS